MRTEDRIQKTGEKKIVIPAVRLSGGTAGIQGLDLTAFRQLFVLVVSCIKITIIGLHFPNSHNLTFSNHLLCHFC